MKNTYWIIAACTMMSACGGGGGSDSVPSSGLVTTDSNFDGDDIVNRTFSGPAVTLRAEEADSVDASATISSALSATIVVDGEQAVLSNFDDDIFESPAGESLVVFTRLNGGPLTEDVLYFVTTDLPAPILAGQRLGIFVDGNDTLVSNLPTGAVTYTGTAIGFNQDFDPLDSDPLDFDTQGFNNQFGSITLNVDFDDSSLDGTLFGINPLEEINYDVDGTAEDGTLIGVISGGDATNGSLTGQIYGSDADQAAGTFLIETTDTDLIGVFSATD